MLQDINVRRNILSTKFKRRALAYVEECVSNPYSRKKMYAQIDAYADRIRGRYSNENQCIELFNKKLKDHPGSQYYYWREVVKHSNNQYYVADMKSIIRKLDIDENDIELANILYKENSQISSVVSVLINTIASLISMIRKAVKYRW